MNHRSTDPGQIFVFRVFAGVKLAFAIFGILASMVSVSPRFVRQTTLPIVSIVEPAILLLYLFIPWLEKKLGKFFLPIAIAIATFGPMLSTYLAIDFVQADELGRVRVVASQWQLIFLLFVPLILVSWQYSLRIVILYCAALAVVDFLVSTPWFLPVPPDRPWVELSPVFFRTAVYILIGFVVNRLVSSQRFQNNQLKEAYQKLASYATASEQLTLSRERNRLARELHDTLAHTLSALAVQLEAVSSLWDADHEKSRQILQQSLKTTRDGLQETRRSIQSLRATPIEELGLESALSNLARSMAERNHLELELSIPEKVARWNPEVENAFYRIAEEALHNVNQHSNATKLGVSLLEEDSRIVMVITDNGIGFDLNSPEPDKNRFGLQGMKERADAIGASLAIESIPGQGTRVQLIYTSHPESNL